MLLLLDTQIVLWLERQDARLSEKALENIFTESNLLVSKASIWEIAIKAKTGKLDLDQPAEKFVQSFLSSYKAQVLDISLFTHLSNPIIALTSSRSV